MEGKRETQKHADKIMRHIQSSQIGETNTTPRQTDDVDRHTNQKTRTDMGVRIFTVLI